LAGSKLQNGVNGTIIADNTKKPKNPKTINQILQRIFVNTVAQAYSAMQPILCHSFEGVAEGAKCMAEFQKLNLAYFRQRAAEVGSDNLGNYINFVPVGEKGVRPAAFIISDGKLPAVPATINAEFKAVMALPANSYQSVIDTYDLQRGDQLTFVAIEESTVNPGQYVVKYARIILDPRNADGSQAPLSSVLIADNAVNLPNSKNEGNFGVLEFADGMVFSMKAGAKLCSVGIIVSRQNGEDWQRSKCQMTVSEDAIGDNGVSLSRAIYRSTHKDTIYIEGANQYLDNAGVGGGQSTDSGSGEAPAAAPVFDNTVSFTANGSTFSNSVAGGSVAVTAPLTKMVVTGQNLTTEMLQISNSGSLTMVGTITKVGENLEVTFGENEGTANSMYVVRKKNEDMTWAEWFTININANAGGGGNPDDGYNND
jgi:hypothetical protein